MENSGFLELVMSTPRGDIYSRTAGTVNSDLVIAIHGWSQRNGWSTWEPLMGPLSEAGFYVVSLDMPGWGRSPSWSSERLSSQDAVDALKYVLANTKKGQAVLMGKSWGGGIAIQMAIEHPSLVTKLILSAPAFREMPLLNKLAQPALIAWAKDDPVIPFGYSKEFLDRIPAVELIVYDHGGHSAAAINAEHFAPEAVRFLLS